MNAVTAIGTVWASSVFFCAVTTTSSIWAMAGSANADDSKTVLMKAMVDPARRVFISNSLIDL